MEISVLTTLCIVLMAGMGHVAVRVQAHGDGCGVQSEGGSAVLMDADSTGAIHFQTFAFQQSFDEECHTDEGRQYRRPDGKCNHVFNKGMARKVFKRLLPAEYGDTTNSPRMYGQDGSPLPSATDVSAHTMFAKNATNTLTNMYMQWGQFIDHDMSLTPVVTKSKKKIVCCGKNKTYPDHMLHPQCFPIRLGPGDADVRFRGDCMEFVRSLPAKTPFGRQLCPREQVNEITSFIDASMVYGSSEELMNKLRTKQADGKPGAELLMSGQGTVREKLLPPAQVASCILQGNETCFLSGDVRVNVQPGLIVMHTLFVRLHNIVVGELRKERPGDYEEDLFQEARKIVNAIVQIINYDEWLPLVIGETYLKQYRLNLDKRQMPRSPYLPSVDPSVANAFATAAFRFGHSNIAEHLLIDGQVVRFKDMFFRPHLVFQSFDGVLRSLMATSEPDRSQSTDRFLADDVTGHMFEPASQVKNQPSMGLDLGALNIQRGRDHGLPSYNQYRKFCGLKPVESFADLGDVSQTMSSLYRSVEDIDLFVGGLLEKPEDPTADVGPTFACIIAQQFFDLKFGDRFWFETDRFPEGFTNDQLASLYKVTLAKVTCMTSNIDEALKNAFLADSSPIKCKKVRKDFMDFKPWQKP